MKLTHFHEEPMALTMDMFYLSPLFWIRTVRQLQRERLDDLFCKFFFLLFLLSNFIVKFIFKIFLISFVFLSLNSYQSEIGGLASSRKTEYN